MELMWLSISLLCLFRIKLGFLSHILGFQFVLSPNHKKITAIFVSLLKDAACQLSLFGSLNYWHFEVKMLGLLVKMPSKLRFFNEHVFFSFVSLFILCVYWKHDWEATRIILSKWAINWKSITYATWIKDSCSRCHWHG